MDKTDVWSRAGCGDVEVGIQCFPIFECWRCPSRNAVYPYAMWRYGLDDRHADFDEILLGFLRGGRSEGGQNL